MESWYVIQRTKEYGEDNSTQSSTPKSDQEQNKGKHGSELYEPSTLLT